MGFLAGIDQNPITVSRYDWVILYVKESLLFAVTISRGL